MKKLALFLLLLASMAARAEEPRLPTNPFEKAQKDDWSVHTGSLKAEGDAEKKTKLASCTRVVAVDGEKVTVSEIATGNKKPSVRTFSTKEAPRIDQFFGLEEGTVSDVTAADDKRTVGQKELSCKKVSFIWTHNEDRNEVKAWLSSEVKGGGVVALEIKGHEKGKGQGAEKGKDGEEKKGDLVVESETKLEVAGWGTGDKKDWGDAPDDVLDDELLGLMEGGLPLDPFAKAKNGDWAAYTLELDDGGSTERGTFNFEVTKAGKKKVELERTVKGPHEGTGTVEFSREDAITIADYVTGLIERPEQASVSGVRVADDKRTIDGKEFSCKRVAFTMLVQSSRAKIKLWLSDEVAATGLVALEVKLSGGKTGAFALELGGYGDDDKTLWGKTADKLGKKKKKKDDE
jgi:hypothetical protein